MKSWPQIKIQENLMKFFSKITDRRRKYCLEISGFKALGFLKDIKPLQRPRHSAFSTNSLSFILQGSCIFTKDIAITVQKRFPANFYFKTKLPPIFFLIKAVVFILELSTRPIRVASSFG